LWILFSISYYTVVLLLLLELPINFKLTEADGIGVLVTLELLCAEQKRKAICFGKAVIDVHHHR
jgi:hypothetical protein